jgi:hypothetical protein
MGQLESEPIVEHWPELEWKYTEQGTQLTADCLGYYQVWAGTGEGVPVVAVRAYDSPWKSPCNRIQRKTWEETVSKMKEWLSGKEAE